MMMMMNDGEFVVEILINPWKGLKQVSSRVLRRHLRGRNPNKSLEGIETKNLFLCEAYLDV